jgi:ElaB/YqjD/DUF883 family membrane-anchored ribosome-binding protein
MHGTQSTQPRFGNELCERKEILMSSIPPSEMRASATKRTGANNPEVSDQIDAIRADIEALTATVARVANQQMSRAQDKMAETARDAEDAVRRNPVAAVAIAAGLGFLFGVFTRR